MARQRKIGLIGCGQMGEALLRGLLAAGLASPEDLTGYDKDGARLAQLAAELGFEPAANSGAASAASEVVVLAVKPGDIGAVLQEIGPRLSPEQILVSIAAGVPTKSLARHLANPLVPIVRVMPNTPCLVRAGMSALAPAPGTSDDALDRVRSILGALGETAVVDEKLLDAVTGLSGSGPAYVFVMIEALADGGVAAGLPRPIALKLAAQTVFGSAKLVVESGKHPAALKDAVASPAGTTIAGLGALEQAGFRAALIEAVLAATERSRQLSEDN